MNINEFTGYSAALDALPLAAKDSIVELIWSLRGAATPIQTVCVVVLSLDDLAQICGVIPSEVSEGYGRRYFVDLESIGTSYERFYVDRADEYSIWGYVYDKGVLTETKVYKRNGKYEISLDRYAPDGVVKSRDEVEKEVSTSAWSGDNELLAISAKYNPICLMKPVSGHTYLRVLDHDSLIANSNRILRL